MFLNQIHKNGFLTNLIKQLRKADAISRSKSRFLFRDPSLPFTGIRTFDHNDISDEFENEIYRSGFYEKLAAAAAFLVESNTKPDSSTIIRHVSRDMQDIFLATYSVDMADLLFSNNFLNDGFMPTHTCAFSVPVEFENEIKECVFYVIWYQASRKFYPVSLS